jgi:hypothetical protein
MATTRVDFTEWLPDQPGVVGALTNAKNVYPKAVGYGAFPLEEDYSAAASEDLNSVFAGKDDSGNTKVFAGGSTKIFLLDASDMSLDDVSGTTYSAGSDWKFIQFGSLCCWQRMPTNSSMRTCPPHIFCRPKCLCAYSKAVNSCSGLCGDG